MGCRWTTGSICCRRVSVNARAGRAVAPDPPWNAAPLAFGPWGAGQPGALALRAWRLPAPLGLVAGLLAVTGLTWGERIATLRWFSALKRAGYQCREDMTVVELTAAMPATVAQRLWHPLCLAALNTQPEVASAQVFANVLRDAFDGQARDTEVLSPSVDLSALVGDPLHASLRSAEVQRCFARRPHWSPPNPTSRSSPAVVNGTRYARPLSRSARTSLPLRSRRWVTAIQRLPRYEYAGGAQRAGV